MRKFRSDALESDTTTTEGGFLLPAQLKKRVKRKDPAGRLLWALGHVLSRMGIRVFGWGQEIQARAITEVVICDDFPGYMMEQVRIQFNEPKGWAQMPVLDENDGQSPFISECGS